MTTGPKSIEPMAARIVPACVQATHHRLRAKAGADVALLHGVIVALLGR